MDAGCARTAKQRARRGGTDLHLLARPGVHAQRLDLGDMGAHLPVEARASHAEEDAQLDVTRASAHCSVK